MTEWEQLERTEVVVRRVTVTYRAPDGVAPMLKHNTKTVYFQPARVRVQLELTQGGGPMTVVVAGLTRDNKSAMAFFDTDSLNAAPPELEWLCSGVADILTDESRS